MLQQAVEEGRPIAQKAFFDFHRSPLDGDRTLASPLPCRARAHLQLMLQCRYMDIFDRYCTGCTFVDPIAVPVIIHR